MKSYKELHKNLYSNFKNYLDNNKLFKQKYIKHVTALTYLSTKPIKYLMLHLMDIQGLDPNTSKVLNENLSKIFGDIEHPAYESDFDLKPFISKIKRDGKIEKFVKVLNSGKPSSIAAELLEKEINLALLECAVDSAGILDLKEESEKNVKEIQKKEDDALILSEALELEAGKVAKAMRAIEHNAQDTSLIKDFKSESEKYLNPYSNFLKSAHIKNKEIQEKRDAISSKCKFKREK